MLEGACRSCKLSQRLAVKVFQNLDLLFYILPLIQYFCWVALDCYCLLQYSSGSSTTIEYTVDLKLLLMQQGP